MNEFHKRDKFQELREFSKQLRARVDADPLRSASFLLEEAIRALGHFDDVIEQNQAQERRRDKLAAEVEHLEGRKETLFAEIAAGESHNEAMKKEGEHWDRVAEDKRTRAMVA